MNIKRENYLLQLKQARVDGEMEGKRLGRNQAIEEIKTSQLQLRLDALKEATKTLATIAEATCRVASAIENITRWPH